MNCNSLWFLLFAYLNVRNYALGLALATILIFGSFSVIYGNSSPQLSYSSSGEEEGGDNDDGEGNNEAIEGREQLQQQVSIETICDDGIDNDGDGLVDLQDIEDCPPAPPIADTDDTNDDGATPPSTDTTSEEQVQEQQEQDEQQQQMEQIPGILRQPQQPSEQQQQQQEPGILSSPPQSLSVLPSETTEKEMEEAAAANRTTTTPILPPGTEPMNKTTPTNITTPSEQQQQLLPTGTEQVPRTCITRLTSLVIEPGNVPGGISAPGTVGVTINCQNSNAIDGNNTQTPSKEPIPATTTTPLIERSTLPSSSKNIPTTTTERAPIVQIKLSSSDTSIATVPEYIQISIPDTDDGSTIGSRSIQKQQDFTITTYPVPSNTYLSKRVSISASLDEISKQASLDVLVPYVKSLTLQPTSTVGGNDVNGIVELTGPAPSGGKTVNLNSAGAEEFVQVESTTLTIPGGFSKSSFKVHSVPVLEESKYTINALTVPVDSKSAELTLTPVKLESLTFDPAPVSLGGETKGIITLTGPAPPGGIAIITSISPLDRANRPTILLESSDYPAAAPPGSSYYIEEGEHSGEFPVRTYSKVPMTVRFTASYNGDSKQANLHLDEELYASSIILDEYDIKGIEVGSSKTIKGIVTLTNPVNTLTRDYLAIGIVGPIDLGIDTIADVRGPGHFGSWFVVGDIPQGSTKVEFKITVRHCPLSASGDYCDARLEPYPYQWVEPPTAHLKVYKPSYKPLPTDDTPIGSKGSTVISNLQ